MSAKNLIGKFVKTSDGNAKVLDLTFTGMTTNGDDQSITRLCDVTLEMPNGKKQTIKSSDRVLLEVAV